MVAIIIVSPNCCSGLDGGYESMTNIAVTVEALILHGLDWRHIELMIWLCQTCVTGCLRMPVINAISCITEGLVSHINGVWPSFPNFI